MSDARIRVERSETMATLIVTGTGRAFCAGAGFEDWTALERRPPADRDRR